MGIEECFDDEECFDEIDEPLEEKDEEELLKEAREKYRIIDVIAPHLDDNLQPAVEVRKYEDCPLGDGKSHGKCYTCEKFMGYFSEDGKIFSFGVYEGFCDTKDKV